MPLSHAERQHLDAWHELAAYDAVGDGVPLLDDADAELAGQAIYTLAWFPEHASSILPGMARIAASEQQPVTLVAASIVAIGLVAREGTTDFDSLLDAHLASDEPSVRWAAAAASAHLAGASMSGAAQSELRTWATGYGDESPETVWEISQPDLALRMLDRAAAPLAGEIRSLLVSTELAKPPKSN